MALTTATVALLATAVTTGAAASAAVDARQAKKTAKHGKERAMGALIGSDEAARVEVRDAKASSKLDRRKRLAGVNRNLNIFSSPLGLSGQASIARKTLVGQ